jgi:hypothetical protein
MMRRMGSLRVLVLAVAALLLTGCRDPREVRLKSGVRRARLQLGKVGRESMATIAYYSTLEQGGTPVTYLIAAQSADADNFCCEMNRPGHPWSVVVRAEGDVGEFVIEGFGESLASPKFTEHARVAPLPPRKP